MIKCKDCKFWIVPEDAFYDEILEPTDEDTCEPKEMPFKVKVCGCPEILTFERPVKENQATVVDGSHYKATLYTGPEFGCVNGKGK